MALHCKICNDGIDWVSVSALRKHQWSTHPERYKGTLDSLHRGRASSRLTGRKARAPKLLRCNQCPRMKTFATISDLRKHQWAKHATMYMDGHRSISRPNGPGRLKKDGTPDLRHIKVKPTKLFKPVSTELMRLPGMTLNGTINGSMTVPELQSRLTKTRDMLNDMLAMIDGILQEGEKH